MSEYFKFIFFLAAGLFVMGFFLRLLIDTLFTTWDPVAAMIRGLRSSMTGKKAPEQQANTNEYRQFKAYTSKY